MINFVRVNFNQRLNVLYELNLGQGDYLIIVVDCFWLTFLFPICILLFFSLEEFIYNYLITLSNYIIPKKGV